MRVKIVLQVIKPQTIEINYNYYLSSLIYHTLRRSSVEFSTKLHMEGYRLGNKNFKLFCFSRFFPNKYSIEKDKLILKDIIEWYVSSPINEFILHLADGLLQQQTIKVGEAEFYVRSAEMMREPSFTNEMKFRSLSPIATHTAKIIDGKKITLSCAPSDNKFAENIKNNLLRKYFLVHGSIPDSLNFEMQIEDKYQDDRGKLIAYKNIRIKGYQIPFTLKCDSKLMQIAYDCGIGEKSSAGMGFIEVARR